MSRISHASASKSLIKIACAKYQHRPLLSGVQSYHLNPPMLRHWILTTRTDQDWDSFSLGIFFYFIFFAKEHGHGFVRANHHNDHQSPNLCEESISARYEWAENHVDFLIENSKHALLTHRNAFEPDVEVEANHCVGVVAYIRYWDLCGTNVLSSAQGRPIDQSHPHARDAPTLWRPLGAMSLCLNSFREHISDFEVAVQAVRVSLTRHG